MFENLEKFKATYELDAISNYSARLPLCEDSYFRLKMQSSISMEKQIKQFKKSKQQHGTCGAPRRHVDLVKPFLRTQSGNSEELLAALRITIDYTYINT